VSVRETILMTCLVALGAVNFREQSAANRRQVAGLLRREQCLARETLALRHRARALRLEADALARDRYFVERVARADLGWRPGSLREPGLGPPGLLQPLEPPSALAQTPRSLPPVFPAPPPPPAPSPVAPVPQPPRADPALVHQALASLGYESVGHFQTKMMRGRTDGQPDAATLTRAQQLAELLRRLGYDSVKTFQRRNRLAPDGIMGRRTEQRALDLLHRRTPRRSGSYLAANGR